MLQTHRYRLTAVVASVLGLTAGGLALAQTGASKAKGKTKAATPAVLKSLEDRTADLQRTLLKDATEISKGFEDVGEYERARLLLEVLYKLDPKLPGLKEKIDQLTDKALDANETEFEIDVARGWTPPLGMVQKDTLVRIEASGDYKFVANLPATADGLPTDDTGSDLVAGLPVGALIGVIVASDTKKQGKPFEIRSKREWTVNQTGLLLLRVNLPNGHKSTGKLKVKLSGVSKQSS